MQVGPIVVRLPNLNHRPRHRHPRSVVQPAPKHQHLPGRRPAGVLQDHQVIVPVRRLLHRIVRPFSLGRRMVRHFDRKDRLVQGLLFLPLCSRRPLFNRQRLQWGILPSDRNAARQADTDQDRHSPPNQTPLHVLSQSAPSSPYSRTEIPNPTTANQYPATKRALC